jgi:hypothetical protein
MDTLYTARLLGALGITVAIGLAQDLSPTVGHRGLSDGSSRLSAKVGCGASSIFRASFILRRLNPCPDRRRMGGGVNVRSYPRKRTLSGSFENNIGGQALVLELVLLILVATAGIGTRAEAQTYGAHAA